MVKWNIWVKSEEAYLVYIYIYTTLLKQHAVFYLFLCCAFSCMIKKLAMPCTHTCICSFACSCCSWAGATLPNFVPMRTKFCQIGTHDVHERISVHARMCMQYMEITCHAVQFLPPRKQTCLRTTVRRRPLKVDHYRVHQAFFVHLGQNSSRHKTQLFAKTQGQNA